MSFGLTAPVLVRPTAWA